MCSLAVDCMGRASVGIGVALNTVTTRLNGKLVASVCTAHTDIHPNAMKL